MAGDQTTIQRREKLAGLILMGSALLALLVANSPAASAYQSLLHWPLGPSLPRFGVLDLHHWIADGLMAIFFLLVGLEVKREWYQGQLATAAARRLPIVAAAAGMAVPALIYLLVTDFDPALVRGWAIPSATDIAFAIGVLALLGTRAPPSIKLLLVTIAIIDDIGAVVIIAVAYTASLDLAAIAAVVVITGIMADLNKFGVRRLWPYLLGFAALWLSMLASGIHPTIAGVVAALTIPLGTGEARSPLKHLEHAIHPWVMFGVMPLFGLASAGVVLAGGVNALAQPLPLGVLAGLFVGKQLGVFGAIWLAVKARLCARPPGARWSQLYGASLLCGIGFTMSLFIGDLAFPKSPEEVEAAKLGILAGSLLSALAGWTVLRLAASVPASVDDTEDAAELFAADET
ncbi:Na+/H+ antiporter NhaA [Sphingomonas sp.]|uniref:Na+/H+ antiporter NhaA n=1 Tax=Sphingomonas sp. TaxID=28214 RepID=UPI00286B8A31|nr:Na+/H+ antiporter NhaA [Sphingomonas sp.]